MRRNTFTTEIEAVKELENRKAISIQYKNDTVFHIESAFNDNYKYFFVGTYHEYKLLCNI